MPWERIEATGFWFLFAATFLAVAVWESRRPKRELSTPVERRWSRHGFILAISTLSLALLYRASPVVLALKLPASKFQLLNRSWLPLAARCALALVLLDLVRYAMHRAYHSTPVLWRVHQVHHSDPEFDVSNGARVHPIEAIVTQGATLAAIAALGAPPLGVFLFEMAACFQSCFAHANASLPAWIERPARAVFVTPDMHRIHHSEEASEQRVNLGDVFAWWDRLFRTYLADPAAGQERMTFGLGGHRREGSLGVAFMLLAPLREPTGELAAVDAQNKNHSAAVR